jgi:DNA-directed RNA polymerase subunit RPC12/RpoP
MNQEDRIVVLREFDNAIQANIIKTKLDAFDIPCFLTEENLANIYPAQPVLSIGVRLHVFQNDVDQANIILEEQNLSVSEESVMCPRCGSNHIEHPSRIINMIRSTFSFIFNVPEHYNCLRCGNDF